MNRVFSKEKFIEDAGEQNYKNPFCKRWVDECDGKTEKEIEKLGYGIVSEWMVEV